MDEAVLIAAAQGGEHKAFNDLVIRYQTLVYNVAYRILGNPDMAADATQEAFISAYRGIGQFRGASFKGWLMRIVTNACYDQLRVKKRRPATSLDTAEYDDHEENQLPDNQQERPEAYVEQQELGHLIQRGLETLPADQRAVIVLIDVQEFQYEEAAEALGISLGTVKSRLNRGRHKLRDFLQSSAELLPSRYRLDNKTGGATGLASLFFASLGAGWLADMMRRLGGWDE